MSVKLYIDGVDTEFKRWLFPGGEVGVQIQKEYGADYASVALCGIPTSEDIFVMLNLLQALNASGWDKNHVLLELEYLPYARQDRICKEGESFALQVFLQVLSGFKDYFGEVHVYDLHSSVSLNLLNFYLHDVNVLHFEQHECIDLTTLAYVEYDAVIAPDKGALEKAKKVKEDTLHFFLNKTRVDGKVVYEDYDADTIVGKVLITDDCLDGGATFISIAEMLRRTQPRITQLDIYCTHGIFSKGFDVVKNSFNDIYIFNKMTDEAKKAI